MKSSASASEPIGNNEVYNKCCFSNMFSNKLRDDISTEENFENSKTRRGSLYSCN